MDLQDALMFKHGALLWLTYHLRDIYGIPQPEGTTPPSESESPNPDNSSQGNGGVYPVAAMCYYLEKAGFVKFQSRVKFIKDELISMYPYTPASIANKWSQMEKTEFRKSKKGAIKQAIKLMEETEKFNLEGAILLAKADISIIENK